MTRITVEQRPNFPIDPAILEAASGTGLRRAAARRRGQGHHFHTHAVDEILIIISGRLNFMWDGGERVCGAGDTILLPPARFTSRRLWMEAQSMRSQRDRRDESERRLNCAPSDSGCRGRTSLRLRDLNQAR